MKKLFINFTIMTALITSMSSLAVASQKPESKLLSGAYYTAGSSYNNSRREVLNRKGKICMKIVDGPAANVRGQENFILMPTIEKFKHIQGKKQDSIMNGYLQRLKLHFL
jgi:hypothetical protein